MDDERAALDPPAIHRVSDLDRRGRVWAGLFAVRATVYTVLILAGKEGALAGAVVVLGWPAFLGALWFCYRYVPRRLKQLGVDVDELTRKR